MSEDRGPPNLSPREARDRWLDKLRVQYSDETVSSYHYRLKLFVEWAEENGIESVADLSGWDLESFETHRRGEDIALPTLKNEMSTLKNWLEYLENVDAVEDGLPEKVNVPRVPPQDRSSDTLLSAEAANQLLDYYRNSDSDYGTRDHVLLELAWHVGARVGAIRALDLRDLRETDSGDRYLMFVNRPETDTRLKKGQNGERPVVLSDEVWDVLDYYIENHRADVSDDHGRQPLLTSSTGRPATSTLRSWIYLATVPCIHSPCPHEKEPISCKYTSYQFASGCPSSRSPHQIRTGSITWMLNRGIPVEVVAERVNSSAATIEEHYDKEDPVQEMLKRRKAFLHDLDIETEIADHDQ
ncbi:tyrosine-type recombinase/integrase [Halobacteriales archaeon Cl-PHB]